MFLIVVLFLLEAAVFDELLQQQKLPVSSIRLYLFAVFFLQRLICQVHNIKISMSKNNSI